MEEKCKYSKGCLNRMNSYGKDDCVYFTFMKNAGIEYCPYSFSAQIADPIPTLGTKLYGASSKPHQLSVRSISKDHIDTFVASCKTGDFVSFSGTFTPDKPKDTYIFRGKTIIEKVIFDCIKDKKNAFLIVEKEKAYFGINRILSLCQRNETPLTEFLCTYVVNKSFGPFYVYEIKKEEISEAIKFLQKEVERIKGIEKILLKKVRKQNENDDKKCIKRETVQVKVF